MSKKVQFRVEGMTCASCEVLLERAFSKIPGVRKAHVSNRKGSVTLTLEDGADVSAADLRRALPDGKYSVRSGDESAARRISWSRLFGALAVSYFLYLFVFRTGLLGTGASPDASAGLLAIFAVGLVAAFSSCTAVVSGLVAAVAASSAESGSAVTFGARIRPHLFFNLGRVAGFAVFGALVGLLGGMLGLSPFMNGLFMLAVAVLMVGLGLNLLGIVPSGSIFGLSRLVLRLLDGRGGKASPVRAALLGASTFFLPCGFTQSMQLFAASTGSPVRAAVIMAVFSLGTVPALLGLGIAASSARGAVLKKMSAAIGLFVIAVGFSNMASAATLLSTSSSGDSAETCPIEAPCDDPDGIALDDGEQVIQMEVTSRLDYAPDVLYVREGLPVRWEIYGDARMGCASSLVLPEFGVRTFLRPGFNTVRFTPDRPGSFTFTCSMGMTRGTMVVLPSGS